MYNLQNIKKIAEEKRISIRELAEFCGKTAESLHGSIKNNNMHLGISKDNQLYSYRDTGIDGLENRGVQRKVIQQLTGHKSEKMVGKYIHKPTQELMDSTMKLFPEELQ